MESKEDRVVSDAVSSDNFSEEIEDEEIEDSHENTRSADKKGFFIIKHWYYNDLAHLASYPTYLCTVSPNQPHLT